ncbi:MAG: hypothetical protein RSE13_12915 [Planktothrix sp. GU0601_MAG3]|nr:MAG: hypothetical protein RSE13_12915 [Planktothrix sp. GU0601_MAG3]
MQPATGAQDIEIAGQDNNSGLTLNLNPRDLNSLENGFQEIIIGKNQGNGTIFIAGNITFKDSVFIQSPQGMIASGTPFREQFYTVTGLDNASLKLSALENITLGNLLTNGSNISITSESGTISTQQLSTGNSGSATIHLTGTEVNLLGGINSVSGSGVIILQPSRNTQAMTLGGTENTSNFNIGSQDLAALTNGFSQIRIGRGDSTNTLTLGGDFTIYDPINLQAQSIIGTGRIMGVDNGSVALTAGSNILIGDISTQGGTIQLTSSQGEIRTGTLQLLSENQSNGNINISASGQIETGEIRSMAQDNSNKNGNVLLNSQYINLISRNGGIRVNGQILNSSLVGDSIAIELLANSNITTGDIKAYRGINLNSTTGTIQSGNLNSVGSIRGGDIVVVAGSSINTGRINASSSEGKGGNISLNASQDIDVVSLRGEGVTQGGDIGISTRGLFRATGTFNSRNQINASISSAGGENGGVIVIQQGGEYCSTAECGNIPFTVGNPLLNGTAGAITDGNLVSILPPTNSSPNSNKSTAETQAVVNQINSELQGTNQETQTSPIPPKTDNNTPVLTTTSDVALEDTSDISSSPEETLEAPIIPLNTPTIPTDQIASGSVISSLAQIDTFRGIEFSNYLGSNSNNTPLTNQSIRKTLNEIYKLTGYKTAIVYVSSQSNQLELRLILPGGQPIFKSIPVPREMVLKTARTFSNQIRFPRKFRGYPL